MSSFGFDAAQDPRSDPPLATTDSTSSCCSSCDDDGCVTTLYRYLSERLVGGLKLYFLGWYELVKEKALSLAEISLLGLIPALAMFIVLLLLLVILLVPGVIIGIPTYLLVLPILKLVDLVAVLQSCFLGSKKEEEGGGGGATSADGNGAGNADEGDDSDVSGSAMDLEVGGSEAAAAAATAIETRTGSTTGISGYDVLSIILVFADAADFVFDMIFVNRLVQGGHHAWAVLLAVGSILALFLGQVWGRLAAFTIPKGKGLYFVLAANEAIVFLLEDLTTVVIWARVPGMFSDDIVSQLNLYFTLGSVIAATACAVWFSDRESVKAIWNWAKEKFMGWAELSVFLMCLGLIPVLVATTVILAAPIALIGGFVLTAMLVKFLLSPSGDINISVGDQAGTNSTLAGTNQAYAISLTTIYILGWIGAIFLVYQIKEHKTKVQRGRL